MIAVKVSAKSARQRFHGCEPDYIANVCHGACERDSTNRTGDGTLIVAHPDEHDRLRELGAVITPDSRIAARSPGTCHFQTATGYLCQLHGTPDKPFGCVASPFTLNKNGTLIIRNRYRLLRCYNDPGGEHSERGVGAEPLPAYVAFRSSLDLIFGPSESARICEHLNAGGGDLVAKMPEVNYRKLMDNDAIKKEAAPVDTTPVQEDQDRPNVLEPGLQQADLSLLREDPDNPRTISDEAFEDLKLAISQQPEMLQARPMIATLDGTVFCGNMRLRAQKSMEWSEGWVFAADLSEREKIEWQLRDNNEYGEWEDDGLAQLIRRHQDLGGAAELLGFRRPEVDELLQRGQGDGLGQRVTGPSLADRFGFPPFTVLDARSGPWRRRKKEWLALGIKSEIGREDASSAIAGGDPSGGDPRYYDTKNAVEKRLGRQLSNVEFLRDHYEDPRGGPDTSLAAKSISVFDPVLCELVYRWFSGPGQRVLDPFAGGSVRGVVASHLGREYVGVDLSRDQVEANREQHYLIRQGDPTPVWTEGDATDPPLPADPEFDLIFTCPPYWNLEVYSKDDRDLSRCASWDDFGRAYRSAVIEALNRLREDRFAAFVVGDLRGRDGQLRSLAQLTMLAAEGYASLYNHAILATQIGSLRIRAAKDFVRSRKLGRTHQHLLVFCKGDPVAASKAAGDVDRAAVQDLVEEAAADEDPDDADAEPG